MYIKQVSIKGFRSYKDLVILGPLEQGQNIIVGVNGSGKSNVLNAIQFVLGDEFTHLQVESRMALLHDTADNNDEAVAFVEIVFDDSEGKLSINSDIVKIKRILTPKKDQCFLNDKCVTKSEITTILESTGFSRSNPYYVVKQGQISQLAVASDFSRLQLIYDVAGIKVYDARKNESARVLAEAQEKHAKAKLILDSIDKRIDAVKAEKEIFQKFEDLTMSSKAINHILIDKEISSINNKLSSLEEGSESYRILSTDLRSQIAQTSQETELCAAEMSSIEGKLNEIGILRQQVNKDIADLLNNKTNLEHKLADIKEKQERIANTSNLLKACESDEAKLLSEISDYDNQLKQVDKTLQEKDILINKLELSKRTLLDKSGRLDQFKSEAERNKWLNERILNVKKDLNNYKTETVAVSDFILANESSIVELESAKSAKRAQILENDDKIRKLNDEIHANKTDLNRLVTDRTDNWKNLLSKKRSIELLNADLKNADNKFRSITGKGIQNGIDSLNAFLNELECDGSYGELVSGYYGTLVENFKCDDVFNAAVESIAGSRLFYHVVKTDQIATRLIKEFNRRKFKGELNFLPLNVLSAKKHEQINNPNVCPLISKLKYDKKIERAVEFVFSRVFLCKNLEIAGDISSEHNVDCVTLEGDQVSRRGSMTGGYRDIRSSKLDLMKNILQLKKTLHDLNQVVVEYTTDVQSIESEINRIEHLLQSQHNELNNLSSIGIKYKEEFQNTEESKKRIYELIADKKRILQTLRNNSQGKRKELNTLQGDLTSPFISELSTADRCERDHITNDILKLNKEIQNLSNKKFEIESTLKNLRFNMDNTITKKKCQLMEGCDQTETDEHQILIEISKLCDAIQEKQTKMNEFEMQEKECQESQNLYRSKIQLLKSKEEDISVKLNETVLELNKVAAKEKMFSDQVTNCAFANS
ncbi:hypothetical protein GJ496_001697 [Pomphorhynchus laevis]|nr:hypothetical protein GJ496_001697 [Pomphorhynchus laevis]